MIEVSQADTDNLVVKSVVAFAGWQFCTNIISGEAMYGTTCRRFFKQNLRLCPNMSAIEGLRLLIGEFQQPAAALTLVGIADHVGDAECRRAWPFGIGKHVKLCDIKVMQELVGLFKVFGLLTTTTNHYINADEGIGHDLLDAVNLIGEQLTVVVTVHQP